ncbi:MAG TPA: DNA polymerase I [Candidatus Moranbacteria bacterium]|nr:DNA polymerase I [Candidatus Moranbacteria bacterium]
MKNKPKKLILIDGNAIIHRSYHALPPLTTKSGELVNAVYGFASTILSVISKFKPDYILATFDLAGPTFRHKEYADYKATRVKVDQELYDQIPRVKELVRAMGIPIYEHAGFEADDVIGTMVKKTENNFGDIENIIVTGDLDTVQLVSPKTKVYTMRRGLTDSVIYDEEKVFERYGLKPDQIIDYKGLRGDPSDNILGVKGIGEKTASELLQKYKTLEGVYENISEIKGTVKEKLERDKMQAIQSKHLATIHQEVPVELNLEEAKTHEFDREKLVRLFQELNFYSLIKRIPQGDSNIANEHSNDSNKVSGIKDFKYELVNEKNSEEFLKMLGEQKEIAIKLKFIGDRILEKKLIGIAFSWKTGRAGFIAGIRNQELGIRNILENGNIKKIGYDLKSDIEILKQNGINLKGELYDVMLSAYVLNPGAKMEFSRLVLEQLGEEMAEEKKKGQLGLQMETEKEISEKECRNADYIFKLKEIFSEKISKISEEQKSENNLENILNKVEIPLVKILAEMEIAGVKLNTLIFEGIAEKINGRVKNLEKNIYELAGEEFNINSPKQLKEILFEKLKISTDNIKKGKTGFSTASSELEKLKGEYKIAEKIEEYREVFKLKTTYLDALPLLVDKNSRIHTTFNQAVTATGRLSSSDPNLQNIPIRTDLGQLLRVAFEAEEGYKLVSADYSQIDLRAVAHVSGDKKMIELFHAGHDIHTATASEINKVSFSQVTQKMRSSAKALNFGVIYGMSVFGFSASAGISRDDAKKFIDAYFEKFTGVAEYMKSTKEFAKINGYVETEMGRRRYIPEINSPNFMVQNAAERMAINMPIQGMSADIVKLAMIKVHEEFFRSSTSFDQNDREKLSFQPGDVKIILQVHDEIILEVKETLAEEVGKKVKEIMEGVYKLKVPLVVDVKIGDNWGEI